MATNISTKENHINAQKLKWGLSLAFLLSFHATILFVSAGRLDWTMAWVYLAVFAACILFMSWYLVRTKPELMAERAELRPQQDVAAWDVRISILIRLGLLLTLAISGLDQRFGWTAKVTEEIPLANSLFPNLATSNSLFPNSLFFLLLGFLGYLLILWALASNNFAAAYVRIQDERGHTVATTGPYRYVRHPFYVGVITYMLALPLVLGSLWALVPALTVVSLFILRTALEDRKLCAELEGYRQYTQQVRYRLIPGIW